MSSRLVRARIAADGKAAPLSSSGAPASFGGSLCEGSAFFVHRPQPGSNLAAAHSARLRKGGADYSFEFQIQCRFKARPRGTVFMSAELRDGPMHLNLVTRALCRVLLSFIQKKAAQRGIELRYSFGDGTSLPNITFPMLAADRLVVSDEPVVLPIDLDEDKGTWHSQDGKLTPIDRAGLVLDEGRYVTIMFATSYVDLNGWCLTGIPGVRTLDLKQFWGNQGLHVAFLEDDPVIKRRIFFELELCSVDSQAEALEEPPEAARPALEAATSSTSVRETVVELADATVEEPEAMSPEAQEDDRMSYYSAAEDRGDSDDLQQGSSGEDGEDPQPGDDDDWDAHSKISSNSRGIVNRLNLNQLGHCSSPFSNLGEDGSSPGGSGDFVAIPWYFLNGAGDLWWCIRFGGRTCWRHSSQLSALCSALATQPLQLDGKSSAQDLEAGRRLASRILEQGRSAPGLLEEFLRAEVDLGSLLSGEVRPRKQAMFLGVVEAEGRIAERYARLQSDTLRWRVHAPGRRRGEEVCVELKRAEVGTASVAGAQAVTLRTQQRGFVFAAKDQLHQRIMTECLRTFTVQAAQGSAEADAYQAEQQSPAGGTRPSGLVFVSDLWTTLRRGALGLAAMVPGSTRAIDTAASVQQRAAVAATSVQQRAVVAAASVQQKAASAASTVQQKAAVHILRPPAPWHDPLQRWPRNRIVINDPEPWLEGQPGPALPLSAELLRGALAAQGASEAAVRELTMRSRALKCVSLAGMGEQDLWCFWVNVFHSLTIHAQLVAGRPRMLQHIVSFFNNCSYLVAGHVFSLAEIEHCILRKQMTRPKIRLVRSILRIWPRTEEDLERSPCTNAPPCPAACFACRPDWRLNLVLNAGNHGSSDAMPVFESMPEDAFEATVQRAISRTLASCGSSGKDSIELPYTLCRYRDDAPPSAAEETETPERRWVKALKPELLQANTRISYGSYGWTMRPHLETLPA